MRGKQEVGKCNTKRQMFIAVEGSGLGLILTTISIQSPNNKGILSIVGCTMIVLSWMYQKYQEKNCRGEQQLSKNLLGFLQGGGLGIILAAIDWTAKSRLWGTALAGAMMIAFVWIYKWILEKLESR
ncbi:MAG: hypothetical protein ACRDA4_01595 [Filifactoraceae bacterium]